MLVHKLDALAVTGERYGNLRVSVHERSTQVSVGCGARMLVFGCTSRAQG